MTTRRKIVPVLLVALALTAWALPAGAEEAPAVPDESGLAGAISQVAEAVAGVFGFVVEDVTALHDEGIGFGAMFKLSLLAHAQGITVPELLAQLGFVGGEDGDFDFGFGELFRALDDGQLALIAGFPKNLGQAIAALHRADHAGQGNHGHGGNPHDDGGEPTP